MRVERDNGMTFAQCPYLAGGLPMQSGVLCHAVDRPGEHAVFTVAGISSDQHDVVVTFDGHAQVALGMAGVGTSRTRPSRVSRVLAGKLSHGPSSKSMTSGQSQSG